MARSVIMNMIVPNANQKGSASSTRFTGSAQASKSSGGGSLASQLRKERQQMQAKNTSRHSHFAGTLVQQKTDGQQRFLSATAQSKSSSRSGLKEVQPTTSAKRKTKKHQHFIGSGRSAIYARSGVDNSNATQLSGGPASRRAHHAIHSFCVRFMTQCYGPVMKSLKNEFRRDSSRLESHDKVVFFRLVWFFCQWWRVAVNEGGMKSLLPMGESTDGGDQSKKSIGPLIFTMDVFTFNLVLSTGDFFLEHKKYKELSQSVALYAEMTHLLTTMYHSSDSTEQIMAMGLMDRLFYQSEPIDRLPKLLSSWIPGTFTREYLCDLLELTHVTLKLLDSNAKACEKYRDGDRKKRNAKKADSEPKDAVTRMRAGAADFDVVVYIARKIISNQTVFMFTQLLSQYNVNATHINDRIVAFFVRLCNFVVASDQDDEFRTDNVDVTLEPMLFNLPSLTVMTDILNDSTLKDDCSFDSVLGFAATVVRHFARASEKNPMLHVEVLFRQPVPHRFCESSSSMYVTEELKMIAERDMLLEQSKEDEDDESVVEEKAAPAEVADADEEEMEFVDEVKNTKKAEPAKDDDSDSDGDNKNGETTSTIAEKPKATTVDKDTSKDVSMIEQELDEDEDRWNDRRSFVPKRKLVVREKEENIDDEENINDEENVDASVDEEEFPKRKNGSEKKRIRRTAPLLDDSDDEDFGKIPDTPNVSSVGVSARMLLEDSDED